MQNESLYALVVEFILTSNSDVLVLTRPENPVEISHRNCMLRSGPEKVPITEKKLNFPKFKSCLQKVRNEVFITSLSHLILTSRCLTSCCPPKQMLTRRGNSLKNLMSKSVVQNLQILQRLRCPIASPEGDE